jgi:hypothetical protein
MYPLQWRHNSMGIQTKVAWRSDTPIILNQVSSGLHQ